MGGEAALPETAKDYDATTNAFDEGTNVEVPLEQPEPETKNQTTPSRLTRQEIWNLTFCLLAWACITSNNTLAVGTSAVAILSIGGDDQISTIPLGAFFFGSALVSFTTTHWLFERLGRKMGFLVGVCLGLVASTLGAISVIAESPALNIIASLFYGSSNGIAFFLRFAAVEVVPSHWAARAVTLTVSGGCFAAFAGPETSSATRGIFGSEPHMEYMGVYLMTGLFNIANGIFISLVEFPTRQSQQQQQEGHQPKTLAGLKDLVLTRQFVIPMLVATCSWAIMAVPMSLVRVAMHQVGYTVRQSLTVIELHFISMFGPGFFIGTAIFKYGPRNICIASVLVFATALIFMLLSDTKEDGSYATWIIGLMLVGIGWNFAFTGATVWLTMLYKKAPQYKSWIQSTNDGGMFLIAGVWIFSASYIHEAGGAVLDGWRMLNFVVVGLVLFLALLLGIDRFLESKTAST